MVRKYQKKKVLEKPQKNIYIDQNISQFFIEFGLFSYGLKNFFSIIYEYRLQRVATKRTSQFFSMKLTIKKRPVNYIKKVFIYL